MKYLVIIFALFVGNVFSEEPCDGIGVYQEYLDCKNNLSSNYDYFVEQKENEYIGEILSLGIDATQVKKISEIQSVEKGQYLIKIPQTYKTYEAEIISKRLDGPKEWPQGYYRLSENIIGGSNILKLDERGEDYCGDIYYEGGHFTSWDYLPTVKNIVYLASVFCVSDIDEKNGVKISKEITFKSTGRDFRYKSKRKFKRVVEFIPRFQNNVKFENAFRYLGSENNIARFEYSKKYLSVASINKIAIDTSLSSDIFFEDFKVEITDITDSSVSYRLLPYEESERLLAISQIQKLKEDRDKQKLEILLARQQAERDAYFKELIGRCIDFGFEGEDNIAACTQREANNDKQLALQQEQINLQTIAIEQNNLRIAKLEDAAERYQEELLDKISNLQASVQTSRSTVNKANLLTAVFTAIPNAYFNAKQQNNEQKRLRNIIRQEVRSARPINYYQNRNN